jgi:hypothetical protein
MGIRLGSGIVAAINAATIGWDDRFWPLADVPKTSPQCPLLREKRTRCAHSEDFRF